MQSRHVVAHGGKHPFHLMVFTFLYGQQYPGGGDHFQRGRQGRLVFAVQLYALGEAFGDIIRQRLGKIDPIDLVTGSFRRANAV